MANISWEEKRKKQNDSRLLVEARTTYIRDLVHVITVGQKEGTAQTEVSSVHRGIVPGHIHTIQMVYSAVVPGEMLSNVTPRLSQQFPTCHIQK